VRVLEGLPAVLTVEEVAKVLRVSKRSVYRLLSEGEQGDRIRAIRIGRLLRVERAELERYLSGQGAAQRTFPWR
jgi:excisionase family DNA binding protein